MKHHSYYPTNKIAVFSKAMIGFKPQRKGFTLVELLIVIAIIMVLAALGFAGSQVVLNKARSTKSLVAANNLEIAVNSFYDEYGMFPMQNVTPAPITTDQQTGVEVLSVLMGKENGTTSLNTKNMPFLALTQGKGRDGSGKRDGLAFNGSAVAGLYDFFGNPYTMQFDDDFNDEILDPFNGQIVRGRKVIIHTPGKDRATGQPATDKDNIISWK